MSAPHRLVRTTTTFPHRALLAAAVVLVTMPAQRADAQLGRLKKAAEQAAKDAVGKKAEPVTGANTSSDNATEITAARLDAIITALNSRVALAQQIATGKALEAEFVPKRKAFEDCVRKAGERMAAAGTPPTADGLQKMAEYNVKVTAYMQRYSAILQDKARQREVLFLQDSATALAMLGQAAMTGTNCGPAPYAPAAVIDRQVAMQTVNADGGQWMVPEANRGSMETWQFGRIRERVALWALIQAGAAKPSEGKFSESEHATMQQKAKELAALAPLFKDGAMTWVTWSDLKSW
jgi:hypothetical protein